MLGTPYEASQSAPDSSRQFAFHDSKVGFAKRYDRKTPITAAELLNDRVLPFFEEHGIALSRVLTDRGTEYCGNPERHECQLYLAVENIDHTRTKTKSPQTNGIVERLHKTTLDEFYRVAFRKKIYTSIEELQRDLDAWISGYNEQRPHQGRWCFGKTRCRPSSIPYPSQRRNLWPPDNERLHTQFQHRLSGRVLTFTAKVDKTRIDSVRQVEYRSLLIPPE